MGRRKRKGVASSRSEFLRLAREAQEDGSAALSGPLQLWDLIVIRVSNVGGEEEMWNLLDSMAERLRADGKPLPHSIDQIVRLREQALDRFSDYEGESFRGDRRRPRCGYFRVGGTYVLFWRGSAAVEDEDGDNDFTTHLCHVITTVSPRRVFAYAFDRMVRSVRHHHAVWVAVDSADVAELIASDEHIDTTMPDAESRWMAVSSRAHSERVTQRGRMDRGRNRKVDKGLFPYGGSGVPFGWLKRSDGSLELDNASTVIRTLVAAMQVGETDARLSEMLIDLGVASGYLTGTGSWGVVDVSALSPEHEASRQAWASKRKTIDRLYDFAVEAWAKGTWTMYHALGDAWMETPATRRFYVAGEWYANHEFSLPGWDPSLFGDTSLVEQHHDARLGIRSEPSPRSDRILRGPDSGGQYTLVAHRGERGVSALREYGSDSQVDRTQGSLVATIKQRDLRDALAQAIECVATSSVRVVRRSSNELGPIDVLRRVPKFEEAQSELDEARNLLQRAEKGVTFDEMLDEARKAVSTLEPLSASGAASAVVLEVSQIAGLIHILESDEALAPRDIIAIDLVVSNRRWLVGGEGVRLKFDLIVPGPHGGLLLVDLEADVPAKLSRDQATALSESRIRAYLTQDLPLASVRPERRGKSDEPLVEEVARYLVSRGFCGMNGARIVARHPLAVVRATALAAAEASSCGQPLSGGFDRWIFRRLVSNRVPSRYRWDTRPLLDAAWVEVATAMREGDLCLETIEARWGFDIAHSLRGRAARREHVRQTIAPDCPNAGRVGRRIEHVHIAFLSCESDGCHGTYDLLMPLFEVPAKSICATCMTSPGMPDVTFPRAYQSLAANAGQVGAAAPEVGTNDHGTESVDPQQRTRLEAEEQAPAAHLVAYGFRLKTLLDKDLRPKSEDHEMWRYRQFGFGTIGARDRREAANVAEEEFARFIGLEPGEDLVELLGGPVVDWRARAADLGIHTSQTSAIFDRERLLILCSERIGVREATRRLPDDEQVRLAAKRTSLRDPRWENLLPTRRGAKKA